MSSFDNRFLDGKTIGFSIGNNQDLQRRGFGQEHLRDITLEFARYLLNSGAQLAFGHDIRSGGYGELLGELNQYYTPTTTERKPSINYLAWPIVTTLRATDKLELADMGIDAQLFECPKAMEDERPVNPGTYFFPTAEEKAQEAQYIAASRRYHWALCLNEMRKKMASETHANLFIGGKLTGFSGLLPGIVEEAWLASKKGNPIYLMGVFGGSSHAISEALQGRNPEVFSMNYHKDGTPGYEEAYERYVKAVEHTDPLKESLGYFQNIGLKGLSDLNGLSIDDNLRLFETPHIPEMVRLVLKGLSSVEPIE